MSIPVILSGFINYEGEVQGISFLEFQTACFPLLHFCIDIFHKYEYNFLSETFSIYNLYWTYIEYLCQVDYEVTA